jgi:hypothetical protein
MKDQGKPTLFTLIEAASCVTGKGSGTAYRHIRRIEVDKITRLSLIEDSREIGHPQINIA